jgi:hypothetical protein
VKKLLFVAVALVVVLCACNRKAFVKKIEGTWKISHYLYQGIDMTASYDSTTTGFQLIISPNYVYNESWKTYTFTHDSLVVHDTISYDSTTMTYHDTVFTLHFIDTTVTPYAVTGVWTLINSEEDLQLWANGTPDTAAVQYNILKLTGSNLNLLNGNKEYDLTK